MTGIEVIRGLESVNVALLYEWASYGAIVRCTEACCGTGEMHGIEIPMW